MIAKQKFVEKYNNLFLNVQGKIKNAYQFALNATK
jgi:hypothetical protein